MLTREMRVPAWVFGMMAFAAGIWSVIGIVVVLAAFQANIVQPQPFSAEERRMLEDGMPGGTFINGGTYRRCVNGSVWTFYSGGAQANYGQPCWK